jgi:hypothetical protein
MSMITKEVKQKLIDEVKAAVMRKLKNEKIRNRPLGKGEKYVCDENGVWRIESAGERLLKSLTSPATDLASTILKGRHVLSFIKNAAVSKRAGMLPGDPATLSPEIARPTIGLSTEPRLENVVALTTMSPNEAEAAWARVYAQLPRQGLSRQLRPDANN